MDIIKKKINLEQFKSRIPGLINVVNENYKLDNNNVDLVSFFKDNASWGKIPVSISILGKTLKYGTIMTLYYKLLDTIIKSVYYVYNKKNKKWVIKDIDWRDIIKNKNNVKYLSYIPMTYDTNYIIGITSDDNVYSFYNVIKILYKDKYDAFDFVDKVNNIIGREIIPYFHECKDCGNINILDGVNTCKNCGSKNIIEIQELHVPYFIYLSELSDIISFMEDLKKKSLNNCCEKKTYKEYGGDVFYNYLLKLKEKKIKIYNEISEPPTIDITLLLTSNLHDMGMYRTYDVDIIDDNDIINNRISNNMGQSSVIGGTNETIGNLTEEIINNGNIVITSGESKLRTLKKRKCSVDDNGVELPGIYNKEKSKLELPYQINYIKNIRYQSDNNDDIFHGDLITNMKEKADSIEVTESYYCNLINMLDNNQYIEGTIINPINTIQILDVKPETIFFNDDTYDKVYEKILVDTNERELLLRNKLLKFIRNNYPKIFCLKQDYEFTYNISYNDSIIKTVLNNETIVKRGSIYVAFDNPKIEITYVLGGRLKKMTNINIGDSKLILNENNPFNLNNTFLNEWDGNGIWYKEVFPMKKFCVNDFIIDNEIKTLTYDVIDIENKEIILNYEGIDFPRNKYILCENIIYKSENYKLYATNDVYFKDEKISSVSFPLNESYDVVIDRGSNAAFEKHLQLSEIKTWEDLENYRNGMFLNK